MMTTLQKMGIEGTCLNIVKATYDKPTTNITLNGEKQRRSKLSLFANDMILYIENTKDSIRKFLELISEFNKVAGYKINTQKSLYISIY